MLKKSETTFYPVPVAYYLCKYAIQSTIRFVEDLFVGVSSFKALVKNEFLIIIFGCVGQFRLVRRVKTSCPGGGHCSVKCYLCNSFSTFYRLFHILTSSTKTALPKPSSMQLQQFQENSSEYALKFLLAQQSIVQLFPNLCCILQYFYACF